MNPAFESIDFSVVHISKTGPKQSVSPILVHSVPVSYVPINSSGLYTQKHIAHPSLTVPTASKAMSSLDEHQPDAWQQNAIFTELLGAPAAKKALIALEEHLRPIFTYRAFYSLETGKLTIKLQTLTGLLTDANILPHFTPHNFKLGLHLAITPTLSQSASPSKDQPLHFDTFINAVAFCAYYYPPATDPCETPHPRVVSDWVGLDAGLDTVRNRLLTHCSSSGSVGNDFRSPATTNAFATPRTTFSDLSPLEAITGRQSSTADQWFTPAQLPIRTKLFEVEQPSIADLRNGNPVGEVCHLNAPSSPSSAEGCKVKSKTSPDQSTENLLSTTQALDSTAQLSEEKKDESLPQSGVSETEKPPLVPKDEDSTLHNELVNSLLVAQSPAEKEKLEHIAESISQVEEPNPDTSFSERSPAASASAESRADQWYSATNEENKIMAEHMTSPSLHENNSPDSAPTNLSLAPSTTLSELPSPGESFQSPELELNPHISRCSPSADPLSSRKLSFSDRDEASDTSSCYENESDFQDSTIRIESAFANGHAVSDCDEVDANSNLSSGRTQFLPSESVTADTVQCTEEQFPSSETSTSLHFLATRKTENSIATTSGPIQGSSLVYQSTLGDCDCFLSDATKGVDQPANSLDLTHDFSRNESNTSVGPLGGQGSQPGCAAILTPRTPSRKTKFIDSDMNVFDDEDHTLLFDQGNESDGSELSMGTRETMSKMVEDYISQHGIASPYCNRNENCIVEDQILISPDRKGLIPLPDENSSETGCSFRGRLFIEEKAETRKSRAMHIIELSDRGLKKSDDRNEQEPKAQVDDALSNVFEEGVSPPLHSQSDSFSSDITPDGLNVIKKQLVLPSPFMFTDSTLGSPISSGSTNEKSANAKSDEKVPNEQNCTMTVSLREEPGVRDEARICNQGETRKVIQEADVMRMVHETLETCRVLRKEVERKQQILTRIDQESSQPQQCYHQRGFGRWIELGIFGFVVVFVTLVLVERRVQRGIYLDVLV